MAKLPKRIQILMVFVLIASLFAPALMISAPWAAEPVALAGIQPALAQIAAESPDEMLRIIVQKADDTDQAERFVTARGGEMVKELSFIHAFVAQIPASMVTSLSQLPSVNWISLDARMVSANYLWNEEADFFVRDEFTSLTFSGNDGTLAWTDDWQEVGESDGPDSGFMRVANDSKCASGACLLLGGSDEELEDGQGGLRSADLRGATAATLSFGYLRVMLEGEGKAEVLISNNGGQDWIKLHEIPLEKAKDRAITPLSFDLTPYLDQEIQVRFRLEADDLNGYIYIDDIQIEFVVDQNTYRQTMGVDQLHAAGITGQGVGVAVIDSGISSHTDFAGRLHLIDEYGSGDAFGHGTHVAGIIGGDGSASLGTYAGVAPGATLISLGVSDVIGGDGSASLGIYAGVAPGATFISLGVSDANGMAYESDVVEAMQWVFENKELINIRVVNLSLNSTLEDSYHNSPIPAAAEILWFNGIVVVASVGNTGAGGEYNTARTSPANDPFIITVGASDENDSSQRADDAITIFSAYGTTLDGHQRPDLIAPGYDIISALSPDSSWDVEHPDRVGLDGEYIRLSGTSMSAPMVSGITALLLQDEPNLTPDQVKYRLMDTGSDLGGYPYLDAYAAVHGTSTESANQDLMPHMLLAKMAMIAYWASVNGGENIDWENVDWGSVNWNSVNWNSVNWNSVNWNSVNWNSVNWNSVNWNSVNWNSVNWNSVNWNSVNWNSVNWNSVNWNSVQMNGLFIE